MTYDEMSDEELLQKAAQDSEAFAHFYKRHVGKTISFAVRRCGSGSEVADLVSAVWLEVLRCRTNFDPRRGRAVAWMLGIAANLSASETRRFRREQEILEKLGGQRSIAPDELAQLDEAIDAAATFRKLADRLGELSIAERSVTELVLLDGLSPMEAAEALGIRPATARMRLARGKAKLRKIGTSFRTPFLEPTDSISQEISP